MLSGAKLGAAASLHVVKVANAAAGPNAGGTITARTIQVRLRCQDNHECLPFYVLVHGIDDPKALGAEPKALRALAQAAMPATVRGGDHAILILETADSRLSFPVICLQSGNRGQKVRVSSPDHARFYDAEVVAAGLLKGSL